MAASNASHLFDNSLLCCLTQAKRSKPKTNAARMMVKPIQPMSRKEKHIFENSYTQDNNGPVVAKRAMSEQQKANKMAFTVSNQPKPTAGMGRLSSNDSGERLEKHSASSLKQASSKCLV
jgi:hypothetical protein